MILGLVSIALCLLSVASGITESGKLHFGLDLHNGKEAIQLRARVGDNMSLVASEFLAKHKMNPDGHPQIFNMLQDAGGVRCDACKTMVELATAHFRDISTKQRPQGDSSSNKNNRVTVGDEAQNKLVGSLCNGAPYADMNEKVKGFCREQLGGRNRLHILKTFEGAPLEASSVPERKLYICQKLLKECPKRKVNPVPISKCQACMEAFETLDFLMRRDQLSIKLGGSQDPLALAKKKKPKSDGFGSSLHVEMRLEELCGELHLHYKGQALEEIAEVCEEIASESTGDVKRAYMVLGKGADYGIPSHSVCVNVAESCTEKEFDANFPYTLNFHANVTNIMAKAETPESRRHDAEL